MTVGSNTETVLVVENSTLWLSAVFGVVGLIVLAAAFSASDKRLVGPALVAGVCAVLCLSKYTFVFDATQRMVRWQTLRFGKRGAGSMPFDEVKDVVLSTNRANQGALLIVWQCLRRMDRYRCRAAMATLATGAWHCNPRFDSF